MKRRAHVTIRFVTQLFPLLATGVLLLSGPAPFGWAEDDVVVLSSGKDGRQRTRITGQIVELTGQSVRVRRSGDREETYPASRIVSFETTWPPGWHEGQKQFREGKFNEALAAYRTAAQTDSRVWVRRKLLARAVDCFRELGQWERAAEVFLSIVGDDPDTPDFEVIPLVWTTRTLSSGEERRARGWLSESESPVAALIGASWLLAEGQRSAAIEKLQQLTMQRDARIALLAEAQLWRTRIVTAKREDLVLWQRQLERLPPPLRGGPYFLLGEAWARLEQPAESAWAYLRVPILHANQRGLATESLGAAARQLEKLGQTDEAQRLRKEAGL